MTLALRQRHRRIFSVLATVLPVLFGAGVIARRHVPGPDGLPPESASPPHAYTAMNHARADWVAKSAVQVRLWREQGTGRLAVGFNAERDFLKPDLLAYWSDVSPSAGNSLPPDAILLGSFAAGPLALPEKASVRSGVLILYSLAHQEIVDVSKPTRFGQSTP